MIFVTVGSRNYPFDRLFRKLDELYEDGTLTETMFAQLGTSTYRPKHYEYRDFISRDEFDRKIREADIIVTHGAAGTIMKALYAGKKVIAVTRLVKFGEVSSDHQIQYNEALSSGRYVLMAALDLSDLGECFRKIYSGQDGLIPWENRGAAAVIDLIDKFIQDSWTTH